MGLQKYDCDARELAETALALAVQLDASAAMNTQCLIAKFGINANKCKVYQFPTESHLSSHTGGQGEHCRKVH